jgi:hypothetical protein
MSDLFAKLMAEDQRQRERANSAKDTQEHSPKSTREGTRKLTRALDTPRELPREKRREALRELPTRDEIQEFSFRLRDELKVKVQAEVPHEWQDEFEDIARRLKVKKLELYRFILGEFLGKVQRRKTNSP